MFGLRVARNLVVCSVALSLACTLAVVLWPVSTPFAASAAAQEEPTEAPVVVRDADSPVGEIIPRPNSGVAPQNPGDRGGAHQLLILGLMLTFMAIAFFSVRRSMKKARAANPGVYG